MLNVVDRPRQVIFVKTRSQRELRAAGHLPARGRLPNFTLYRYATHKPSVLGNESDRYSGARRFSLARTVLEPAGGEKSVDGVRHDGQPKRLADLQRLGLGQVCPIERLDVRELDVHNRLSFEL